MSQSGKPIRSDPVIQSTVGLVGTFLRGVRVQFSREGLLAFLIKKKRKVTWIRALERAHDITDAEYRRYAMEE